MAITQTQEKETTGKIGERVAANFLKNHGYEIVCLNFQNATGRRLGEIDIIARDIEAQELVFVEVKTRDFQKYGDTLPEENITYSKLYKLQRISQDYLRKNNLFDTPHRFDAVSVWLNKKTRMAKVKHLKNIFL